MEVIGDMVANVWKREFGRISVRTLLVMKNLMVVVHEIYGFGIKVDRA